MRDFVVTTTAIIGIYLSLGMMLLGVWLVFKYRRFISGAVLVLGGGAALVVGLAASTKYWFGGIAAIELDLKDLMQQLAANTFAIAFVFLICWFALWLFRSTRSLNRFAAFGLVSVSVVSASLVLVSLSEAQEYRLEGDAAIPVTERKDPEGLAFDVTDGFAVRPIVQSQIGHPTALSWTPDSRLYISDVEGRIWRTAMADDGGFDEPVLVLEGLNAPLGLAWYEDELYVSFAGQVDALTVDANGDVSDRREVITGLPAQIYVFHQNNQLAIGPDGRVYVGIGATSDADVEDVPLAATIVSFNTDGSDLQVVATGLRNPYGLAFDSDGQLWATDNGPAHGFSPDPPEELNAIMPGKDYGFPGSYGTTQPEKAGEMPVATFPPHSSADGILFYPEDTESGYPSEYGGDLFVAAWGNGTVYRVQVHNDGGTFLQRTSEFASGFSNPLALAIDDQGRLLVADYTAQAVFVVEPA